MNGYLTDIVKEQKKGHAVGAVSVCSATNFVVKAAMKQALKNKLPVLIEATANQVDQNGGYTAMTPADFAWRRSSGATDQKASACEGRHGVCRCIG